MTNQFEDFVPPQEHDEKEETIVEKNGYRVESKNLTPEQVAEKKKLLADLSDGERAEFERTTKTLPLFEQTAEYASRVQGMDRKKTSAEEEKFISEFKKTIKALNDKDLKNRATEELQSIDKEYKNKPEVKRLEILQLTCTTLRSIGVKIGQFRHLLSPQELNAVAHAYWKVMVLRYGIHNLDKAVAMSPFFEWPLPTADVLRMAWSTKGRQENQQYAQQAVETGFYVDDAGVPVPELDSPALIKHVKKREEMLISTYNTVLAEKKASFAGAAASQGRFEKADLGFSRTLRYLVERLDDPVVQKEVGDLLSTYIQEVIKHSDYGLRPPEELTQNIPEFFNDPRLYYAYIAEKSSETSKKSVSSLSTLCSKLRQSFKSPYEHDQSPYGRYIQKYVVKLIDKKFPKKN